MISVDEAFELVRRAARPGLPKRVPLREALGLVLAEDVSTEIDSPPHDKSLVDGYAVRAADVSEGAELQVLERITAGDVPRLAIAVGQATQIMTGAPIPEGADAVVMNEHIERCDEGEQERIRILRTQLRPGKNLLRRGESMRRGQCVLQQGKSLRPIEIGLLAEIGRTDVLVRGIPTVAVVSTGNELVAHDVTPGPGQIRNSNGPMLAALAARSGAAPRNLGIARDNQEDLELAIATGLQSDILVLSGGVSVGVMDLTPRVLQHLGVAQVFHHVNLKPGRPLWFGIRAEEDHATLVFGLPGNPVSALVCFELFVRPAICALAGRNMDRWGSQSLPLACDHRHRSDRPTFFPACLENGASATQVRPLAWKGSADLCTLTEAQALAFFPPGQHDYAAGDLVDVYCFA